MIAVLAVATGRRHRAGAGAVAPTVSAQPTPVTVDAGQSVTLNCAFTGYPTPSVQWEKSTDGGSTWGNVSGAMSTTLSIPVSVTGDSGSYRCKASNPANPAVYTNAVTVTVNSAFSDIPGPAGALQLPLEFLTPDRNAINEAFSGAYIPVYEYGLASLGPGAGTYPYKKFLAQATASGPPAKSTGVVPNLAAGTYYGRLKFITPDGVQIGSTSNELKKDATAP